MGAVSKSPMVFDVRTGPLSVQSSEVRVGHKAQYKRTVLDLPWLVKVTAIGADRPERLAVRTRISDFAGYRVPSAVEWRVLIVYYSGFLAGPRRYTWGSEIQRQKAGVERRRRAGPDKECKELKIAVGERAFELLG